MFNLETITPVQIVDNVLPDASIGKNIDKVLLEIYLEHDRDPVVTDKRTFVHNANNCHFENYCFSGNSEIQDALRDLSLEDITNLIADQYRSGGNYKTKRIYLEINYDNGEKEISVWNREKWHRRKY